MANAKYLDMVGLRYLVEKIKANFTTYKLVPELPSTDINTSAIYLHKKTTDAKSYTASVHVDGAWVNVGDVDLSGYAKLNGNNTFTGENKFSNLMASDTSKQSKTKLFATDGSIFDVDAIIKKNFEFKISSFYCQNTPVEVTLDGAQVSPNFKWAYLNLDEYYKLGTQTITGPQIASGGISIDNALRAYEATGVKINTNTAGRYTYTLTSQLSGESKTVSANATFTVCDKTYNTIINKGVTVPTVIAPSFNGKLQAGNTNTLNGITLDNQCMCYYVPTVLGKLSSIIEPKSNYDYLASGTFVLKDASGTECTVDADGHNSMFYIYYTPNSMTVENMTLNIR